VNRLTLLTGFDRAEAEQGGALGEELQPLQAMRAHAAKIAGRHRGPRAKRAYETK